MTERRGRINHRAGGVFHVPARPVKVKPMRQFALCLLALFFTVAVPALALAQSSKSKKDPDWALLDNRDFKYKTAFPGKTKEVTKKPNSKAGELTVHTVSHEDKDRLYAVTTTQYPDKLKDADPKLVLLAAKDALSANGGKIVADESVTVTGPDESKLDGRDLTVEFGKSRIRTRLVLVGPTLYQVSVTGTEKALKNDMAEKFIRAFEVTK